MFPLTFTGSMSSDDVKRQLDEARIFCLPSVTAKNGDAEGLPIVILEAQACGVPVVTSAKGGATEALCTVRPVSLLPKKMSMRWRDV
ncbi:MAG: glycosyltransferase [Alphaproteobacteria bacterium]